MRTLPPTLCCIGSTFLPLFALCYFCGYFCDLCVAAAFSPFQDLLNAFVRLSLRPLCRRRLRALTLSVVCVLAASSATFVAPFSFSPSLRCCMRFCGLFYDLCVARFFSRFFALLYAFLHAIFVSPLPSRPSSRCCLRFCGYFLRSLCRRHLLALLRAVVCVFAATSATFVSPPPSRRSKIC